VAEEALEVAAAAASAKLFLGIEGNDGVAALPGAFRPGIAAVANAVAEGPDTIQLVEDATRSGDAGGGGVGIVVDAHGNARAVSGKQRFQRLLETKAFNLLEVGRFFNHSIADDSRKSDTKRDDRLMAGHSGNEFGDFGGDRVGRHGEQSVVRFAFFRENL